MAKYWRNWKPIYTPSVVLDPPNSLHTTATWTEGGGSVALANNADLTFRGHATVNAVTMVLSGLIDADEQLQIAGIFINLGIDATEQATVNSQLCDLSYVSATYTITITANSGELLISTAQTIVRSLTKYDNATSSVTAGIRTITITATGDGRTSVPAIITLDVRESANVAPVVMLGGATQNKDVTYTDGDGTTSVCTTATVTDSDDVSLLNITYTVTGYAVPDDEIIKWNSVEFPLGTTQTATTMAGSTLVSVAHNGTTRSGVITKSGGGEIPIADAQTLLRTLAYVNDTSPSTEGTRAIAIQVNDGEDTSESATISITIVSTGAPSLTRVAPQRVARGQTIANIVVQNTGGDGTYSITAGTLPSGLGAAKVGTDYIISGTVSGTGTATTTITVECSNSYGTDSVSFSLRTYTTYTNITAASSFPVHTTAANQLLVVTEDIAADGIAIVVRHTGCAVDGQGHTITYDNATPITIENYSFEDGTGAAATHWDFSAAPNAERYAGVYLNSQVSHGTYSLKFNDTTLSEYVENDTDITLEANTWYTVSGMFRYGSTGTPVNPGVIGYVSLIGSGLTTKTAQWADINNRGIQYVETRFLTGATAETYTVRVGVIGHASSTLPFWIDEIKVQRYAAIGVVIGSTGTGPYTGTNQPTWAQLGVTGSGAASDASLVNCTLTQGADGATWSPCVHLYQSSNTFIGDNTMTVRGTDSHVIRLRSQSGIIVDNNVFTSNVTTVSSRDNQYVAMIGGPNVQGTFTNNEFWNGPQAGINSNGPITAYGNYFRLKAGRYTNNFAIFNNHTGANSYIYDNIVDCGDGVYSSRGIHCGGSGGVGWRYVYNNTVTVQTLPLNQEYAGVPIGGAYGMQLEEAANVDFYNNTVTVNCDQGEGYACRLKELVGNCRVHDNVFSVIVTNGQHGAAVRANTFTRDAITFEDNTLVTNDAIVGHSSNVTMNLVRSTLTVNTPLVSGALAITSDTTTYVDDLRFIDPIFTDATSRSHLEDAEFTLYSLLTADTDSTVGVSWTTTTHVQTAPSSPAIGASVLIETVANVAVASGTTDSAGDFVAIIPEWSTTGATKTTHTPHDFAATSGALTGSATQTIDTTETVTITVT